MAVKLKVIYNDGREVVATVTPRVQVMAERFYGGNTKDRIIEVAFYLAWASLNKAGKEPADFETFLDLIADAEQIEKGENEDPTGPAPTPAESSD